MPPPNRPILLVEDDENDVLFMKMALEAAGVQNRLFVVTDGGQALEYLGGTGEFTDRKKFPVPYLILLDLKLPQVMGLDVLKWLRGKDELASTVVIVVSASANPADVEAAYRHGANAYIVKPPSFDKLQSAVQSIRDFWLRWNQPTRNFG